LTVQPYKVADEKAVFAVESRNVVPARAHIAGTVSQFASASCPGIMIAVGCAIHRHPMIGFIALAGFIVRNSILLVGCPVPSGSSQSCSLRAATILSDPIFQGLAISLLFGLAFSTLLTVLVIPAIYVVLRPADRVLARPV
jgi:multidrug efflux pump subunit AcrB